MGRYKAKDHKRDTIIGKLVNKKQDYDDDQIRALWSACDAMNGKSSFGAIVKVLLLSAQRKEKVASMRWADLANGEWTIPAEAREKANAETLRLPQAALDIIEAQQKVEGNPYVFPGTKSGRRKKSADGKAHKVPPEPPSFNSFSQRKEELDLLMLDELHKVGERRNDQAMLAYVAKVRAVLKAVAAAKSGEAKKKLRDEIKQIWWVTHDLRHTAKSLMGRAGVRPDISERVLGHAIPGVEGTYDQHDYRPEKADALQRLADLIETILHPPEGNVVGLRL
jgi:integrase